MSRIRPILVLLALAASVFKSQALPEAITQITNGPPPPESISEGTTSAPPGPETREDESIYRNEPDHLKIELNAVHRRTFNTGYEYLSGGELAFLTPGDQNVIGLSLGLGVVQLASWSAADQTARQPFYLEPGIVARHYFTPSHVFLRPYVTLNVAYFWMAWDYRTPVPVDNGTVGTDSIAGLEASAGLGLSLRFHERVSLFGEINGGGVVLPDQTDAGVDNTFFGNFEYVGVKTGLTFSF